MTISSLEPVICWSECFKPNKCNVYDHCVASVAGYEFKIEWKSWKDFTAYTLLVDGIYHDTVYELDEAKNLANTFLKQKLKMLLLCFR